MSFRGSITVFTADLNRSRAFYLGLLPAETARSVMTPLGSVSGVAREDVEVGGVGGSPAPYELRLLPALDSAAAAGHSNKTGRVESARMIFRVAALSPVVGSAVEHGGVIHAFLHEDGGQGPAHVLLQDPDDVLLELIELPDDRAHGGGSTGLAAVGITSTDFDTTVAELCGQHEFEACDDVFHQAEAWPERGRLDKLQTLRRGDVYIVVSQYRDGAPPLSGGPNYALSFIDSKAPTKARKDSHVQRYKID